MVVNNLSGQRGKINRDVQMDDTRPDMTVAYVDGLASGLVIQFGTGDWQDGTVRGPAISEDAFDLLEPSIQRVVPEWVEGSRYGVTPMSPSSLASLVEAFRALEHSDSEAIDMAAQIRTWLSDMAARNETVTIFGI
jgi:hypothetical protein